MPEIVLKNMKFGQQADGGIREDPLLSFRRLVNYDIIFGGETPRLRVRPGFDRWSESPLPDTPLQLYAFVDMDENSHVIARCDDNEWKEARETGSHLQISAFTATGRKPVCQYGNRLFLGTDGTDPDDSGMVWTDDARLNFPPASHRVGIKPPGAGLLVSTAPASGNPATPVASPVAVMNTTDNRKLAIEYNVGPVDETIDSIFISVKMHEAGVDHPGSWHVTAETDNAGEPSGTLLDDDGVSVHLPVTHFNPMDFQYRRFQFRDQIVLPASTTVWFVLQGDDEYYDNFQRIWDVTDFYGVMGLEGLVGTWTHGPALYYDSGPGTWIASSREAVWYIGGIDRELTYGYVITYYNTTYDIESRKSNEIRSEIGSGKRFLLTGFPATTDLQVDKVRIYRREMESIEDHEDDITDEYKYVGEADIGSFFWDSFGTGGLGAILQTDDHYCLDETTPEGEEGRESAIIPDCACMWKGRIWIGVAGSNKLAFSKVLEQDGATGLIGTSAPDFFPLKNVMDIPEPAYPVDLYPLSNDQLVVYMSNETTYVIYGGDQPLNPPADFAINPISQTHGLIDKGCFCPMGSKHWVMTRDGLYSVEGISVVNMSYESESNASIISPVENQYLDDTRMIAFGNEVWILLDTNNDGDKNTILILNMEREILSRALYERHWKMYEYPVTINDFCMFNTGDEFRQLLAADDDSNYILELNIGTDDNGATIEAYSESHDLSAPDQAMIYQIDIDAFYPDESAVPTYTWLLTDHAGNTKTGTMSPAGNEDVRGHRSGTRLKGAISVRARLSQLSTKADEIRAIVISFTGE